MLVKHSGNRNQELELSVLSAAHNASQRSDKEFMESIVSKRSKVQMHIHYKRTVLGHILYSVIRLAAKPCGA